VQPLKSGEKVWYLKAAELAEIGEWARTGRFPTHRVIAVSGESAPQTGYFRVRRGAVIHTLTGGKPIEGDGFRLISGTVLSGDRVDPVHGFLGHWHHTLTIIPDGEGRRDLFGWILPQPGKVSAARSTFSFLGGGAPRRIDARIHGGPRANVNIRAMESVTPLDIYPTFLVRAIQANDIEEAIKLGLLEVTEEDVALCTFADPCKTDVGAIVRKGLELYEAEY
jgi:Na+-transporting NADH:ubiquinone oxidoreductase subunit A